jgi:hypothetical protein
MKRPALFFTFIFILSSIILAQTVIENPEKPLNKNAGRTLKLVEELRITDESGVFYFRSPDDLRITKDGHIYIADPYGNNFIKFSPNGEFLKNLYRKGEGPGEIQDYFGYALSLNSIYIYDFGRRKIIVIDHEGNLLSEFKLETETYSDFLGIYKDWLVFIKDVWPPHVERKTSRFYEIKKEIIKLSKDGKTGNESYTFSHKRFLIASSLGGGMKSWDPFDSALDEKTGYFYVSCTREYMVHLLDLNKGKVIRSFRRKYKKVRHEMSQREEDSIKKFNAPRKKYEEDIKRLHLYKGLLWVETSTKDEKRGIMIDVFNNEGQFLDNFYLSLDGNLMSVQDNFIFVVKSDEEGNYVIKKCIIEDEN